MTELEMQELYRLRKMEDELRVFTTLLLKDKSIYSLGLDILDQKIEKNVIFRLIQIVLLDDSPLTPAEIEHAKTLIEKFGWDA